MPGKGFFGQLLGAIKSDASNVKKATVDKFFQKQKPSVVGNLILGRSWNDSLPSFGGQNQLKTDYAKTIQAIKTSAVTPISESISNPRILTPQEIKAGMLAYNPNAPLANEGEALSEGMKRLSKTKIDPI